MLVFYALPDGRQSFNEYQPMNPWVRRGLMVVGIVLCEWLFYGVS